MNLASGGLVRFNSGSLMASVGGSDVGLGPGLPLNSCGRRSLARPRLLANEDEEEAMLAERECRPAFTWRNIRDNKY